MENPYRTPTQHDAKDAIDAIHNHQANLGDYTNLLPRWEEVWTEGPEDWTIDEMAKFIAMRRSESEDSDVSDILTAMNELSRQDAEGELFFLGRVDYSSGMTAFLEGDREKGLGLIRQAVEKGHFIQRNVAWLQTLYDEPEFTSILAIQEGRQERERNKFLSIVCNENPYESFWQPEEGTCEHQ